MPPPDPETNLRFECGAAPDPVEDQDDEIAPAESDPAPDEPQEDDEHPEAPESDDEQDEPRPHVRRRQRPVDLARRIEASRDRGLTPNEIARALDIPHDIVVTKLEEIDRQARARLLETEREAFAADTLRRHEHSLEIIDAALERARHGSSREIGDLIRERRHTITARDSFLASLGILGPIDRTHAQARQTESLPTFARNFIEEVYKEVDGFEPGMTMSDLAALFDGSGAPRDQEHDEQPEGHDNP